MIFFFVKLFEDKHRVEQFQNGTVTAQRLSYFRELDPDEGTLFIHPTKVQIGTRDLTPDLRGPILAKLNWLDNLHMFSVYAAHLDSDTLTDTTEFRRRLRVSDDFLAEKQTAVVVNNPTSFIDRIEKAANVRGYGMYRGLVQYFDPDRPNTELLKHVDPRLPGLQTLLFRKSKYQFQSEYRFVLITGSVGHDALNLQIGDISDITICVEARSLNRRLEVRFPGEDVGQSLSATD